MGKSKEVENSMKNKSNSTPWSKSIATVLVTIIFLIRINRRVIRYIDTDR